MLRRKIWAGDRKVEKGSFRTETQKLIKWWGLCDLELSQGELTPPRGTVGDAWRHLRSHQLLVGRHHPAVDRTAPHNRGSPRPTAGASC